MNTIMRLLGLLLIGTTFACEKAADEPRLTEDYLIFGHYYGLCEGEECVETYKLTATVLFEDTNDNYGGDDFEFEVLSEEQFQAVRDLRNQVPSELLEAADQTFGCPDCYDQGGIFIRIAEGDNVQTWFIDQTQADVPTYLHSFMDEVTAKIARIND